jgi:hypothetical protein
MNGAVMAADTNQSLGGNVTLAGDNKINFGSRRAGS